MRRSTVYSASSWVLSVVAHVAAVVALAQSGPVQARSTSDAGPSREILLLPPRPDPTQPRTPPKPAEPQPTPQPIAQPEPPEPEPRPVVLGIDEGSINSKNWLGDVKETPHTGPIADQDQAEFTRSPGVPLVGQTSVPAAPSLPVPSAQAPSPVPPNPSDPKDAPEPKPESAESQPQQPVQPSLPPVPARQVVPSQEQVAQKDALQAEAPRPGLKEQAPVAGADQAPKRPIDDESKKIDATRNGELPLPIPGARPDGNEESKTPARQQAAPPEAPRPPDGAAIDPEASPNLKGDPNSPVEKKDDPPNADPRTDPDRIIQEQEVPAKDMSNAPETNEAALGTTNPPSAAERAEQLENMSPVPPMPGREGKIGAETPGDRPGIASDRESDASAVKAVVNADRLGKPLAAKGLNISTVRPRWTTTTTLTTSPKSPVVRIWFRRDGSVSDVKFVEGFSTGYTDVDEPLLDAIHRWRAKGKALEAIPPGDTRGLLLVLKVQLR